MRHLLFVCGGIVALASLSAPGSFEPSGDGRQPHRIMSAPAQQSPAAGTGSTALPRTAWGDPDLEGVWNFAAGTPLERPDKFAGREFMNAEELAREERAVRQRSDADRRDGGAGVDVSRETNEFWYTRRQTILTNRTALIVDPPDGKLPPLLEEADRKRTANAAYLREHPADSWEDRRLTERCITFLQNGPPIIPFNGANDELLLGFPFHFQVIQARGYVVIRHEELSVRIIPLDEPPRLPEGVGQWLGASRGHWENRTLVVETTNFREGRPYAGAFTTARLRLVERFTRVSADTIDYRFTVTDPATWSRPWTAAVHIARTNGQIYEFACHEGNYGLRNILSAARALETRR